MSDGIDGQTINEKPAPLLARSEELRAEAGESWAKSAEVLAPFLDGLPLSPCTGYSGSAITMLICRDESCCLSAPSLNVRNDFAAVEV